MYSVFVWLWLRLFSVTPLFSDQPRSLSNFGLFKVFINFRQDFQPSLPGNHRSHDHMMHEHKSKVSAS